MGSKVGYSHLCTRPIIVSKNTYVERMHRRRGEANCRIGERGGGEGGKEEERKKGGRRQQKDKKNRQGEGGVVGVGCKV